MPSVFRKTTAVALAATTATLFLGAWQSEGASTEALAVFTALQRADADLGVSTTQVRRVRDQYGRMVGVVEQLEVRPWDDEFRLVPVTPTGQPLAETSEAVDRYREHAGFIHRHQSFRVHDAALAATNYIHWPLDTKVRAGRPVSRALVIPRALDRSVWVLEVDQQTGYPLYRAEYDSTLQLVSELEVTSFQLTVPPGSNASATPSGDAGNTWGWVPSFQTTEYPSAPLARQALASDGDAMEIPDASLLGWGFRSHMNLVSEHHFDMERKALVSGFTDGIDEVFFVQDEGRDPLSVLPSQSLPRGAEDGSHSIVRFLDQNVRQYTFFHRGVLTVVVGRGSQLGMDAAAKAFYRQFVR